eukprot:g37204.t1
MNKFNVPVIPRQAMATTKLQSDLPLSKNAKRWKIIYPAYIDSKKKISEGQIHECCQGLKLRSELENKSYPRDWMNRGRVRVLLWNDDGTPCHPEIHKHLQLLKFCGRNIPQLESYQKRQAKQAAAQAKVDKSTMPVQRSRLFHNLIRTTQRPPGYVAHNISRDPGLVDCTVDLCRHIRLHSPSPSPQCG